jgi:hypothetical protein
MPCRYFVKEKAKRAASYIKDAGERAGILEEQKATGSR